VHGKEEIIKDGIEDRKLKIVGSLRTDSEDQGSGHSALCERN
jgi:hypothetical protein